MSRGDHFYTTAPAERDSAAASGYALEGTECFVYPARPEVGGSGFLVPVEGTVSLYRLHHPETGQHFYTTVPAERDSAVAAGWISDWVECFVYPARPEVGGGGFLVPLEGTVPLYRIYHAESGDHAYTTSAAERDSALTVGWIFEWVECYVYPARPGPGGGFLVPVEGTVRLFRLYLPPGDGDKSFWDSVGDFVSDAVNTVVGVITTVVGAVIDTVEPIIGAVVGAADWVLEIILSIPLIGRLINWVLKLGHAIVNFVASLPDFVLTLIGIMPEKRLRLCVVIQKDQQGQDLCSLATVLPYIQFAIDVFKDQANVRVLPVGAFKYSSAFADSPKASDEYTHIEDDPSDNNTLIVNCDAEGWLEDLGDVGGEFNLKMRNACFWGNARRLIGYGAPVTAFAVQRFQDGKIGCGIGPLADYVTVNFNADTSTSSTLAHEMAHCCGLPHLEDTDNLMNPNSTATSPTQRRSLTRLQKAFLRASRHATYF